MNKNPSVFCVYQYISRKSSTKNTVMVGILFTQDADFTPYAATISLL